MAKITDSINAAFDRLKGKRAPIAEIPEQRRRILLDDGTAPYVDDITPRDRHKDVQDFIISIARGRHEEELDPIPPPPPPGPPQRREGNMRFPIRSEQPQPPPRIPVVEAPGGRQFPQEIRGPRGIQGPTGPSGISGRPGPQGPSEVIIRAPTGMTMDDVPVYESMTAVSGVIFSSASITTVGWRSDTTYTRDDIEEKEVEAEEEVLNIQISSTIKFKWQKRLNGVYLKVTGLPEWIHSDTGRIAKVEASVDFTEYYAFIWEEAKNYRDLSQYKRIAEFKTKEEAKEYCEEMIVSKIKEKHTVVSRDKEIELSADKKKRRIMV